MSDKVEYISITTADAVEAVLNGDQLVQREIQDFGALIARLQDEVETRSPDMSKLKLDLVRCRIQKCSCRNQIISIPIKLYKTPEVPGTPLRSDTTTTRFQEDADFSHAQFKERADFSGAVFEQNAEFSYARFESDVSFDHALFGRQALFTAAEFCQRASFLRAVFSNFVHFGDASFCGAGTRFSGAIFEGKAYFGGATFAENACYEAATFKRTALFIDAEFRGEADFKKTRFMKDSFFERAIFGALAAFDAGSISGRMRLAMAKLQPEARLGFGDVNLLPGGRIDLTIDQIGRCQLFGKERTLIAGEESQERGALASAAAQYNMLRDNFRALPSRDEEEDRCHYKYMDLRRKASDWNWLHRFFNWLVLKVCWGYGVYPWRIAICMGVVITLFAGFYALVSGPETIKNYNPPLEAPNAKFDPLYFSIITFTTIGYGDYAPIGWLRYMAGFEGLLGLFLMAVFTVSFARKFIR